MLDTKRTGYLAVYPYGMTPPFVSNANRTTGQSASNLVLVPAKNGNAPKLAAKV